MADAVLPFTCILKSKRTGRETGPYVAMWLLHVAAFAAQADYAAVLLLPICQTKGGSLPLISQSPTIRSL